MNCDGMFYGSVTVGERGQIVIPAEARAELGLHPGDKLLVMKHPAHKGLMVFKFEAMRQFMDEFAATVEKMEKQTEEKNIE
jgi:AbrB family looped-hinge helix DNA binding protein